jgi:MHS family citrate/tricarballylate:H+ symporter-like MFS transporter
MSRIATRQVAAVVIGNALEFYDFLTYAVLSLMNTLGSAPVLVSLTEALPVSVRSGALAITYALAISFGGTAQFIVASLIVVTGNPLAPEWYMMGAVGIGVAAMVATRETAPVKTAAPLEFVTT